MYLEGEHFVFTCTPIDLSSKGPLYPMIKFLHEAVLKEKDPYNLRYALVTWKQCFLLYSYTFQIHTTTIKLCTLLTCLPAHIWIVPLFCLWTHKLCLTNSHNKHSSWLPRHDGVFLAITMSSVFNLRKPYMTENIIQFNDKYTCINDTP